MLMNLETDGFTLDGSFKSKRWDSEQLPWHWGQHERNDPDMIQKSRQFNISRSPVACNHPTPHLSPLEAKPQLVLV